MWFIIFCQLRPPAASSSSPRSSFFLVVVADDTTTSCRCCWQRQRPAAQHSSHRSDERQQPAAEQRSSPPSLGFVRHARRVGGSSFGKSKQARLPFSRRALSSQLDGAFYSLYARSSSERVPPSSVAVIVFVLLLFSSSLAAHPMPTRRKNPEATLYLAFGVQSYSAYWTVGGVAPARACSHGRSRRMRRGQPPPQPGADCLSTHMRPGTATVSGTPKPGKLPPSPPARL